MPACAFELPVNFAINVTPFSGARNFISVGYVSVYLINMVHLTPDAKRVFPDFVGEVSLDMKTLN